MSQGRNEHVDSLTVGDEKEPVATEAYVDANSGGGGDGSGTTTAISSPFVDGTDEQYGDGETKVFRIETNTALAWADVVPVSDASTPDRKVEVDGTEIVVTYYTAPVDGAVLVWTWFGSTDSNDVEIDSFTLSEYEIGSAEDSNGVEHVYITHTPTDTSVEIEEGSLRASSLVLSEDATESGEAVRLDQLTEVSDELDALASEIDNVTGSVSVSDDGTAVADTTSIDFGENLSVTSDGEGGVTIDGQGGDGSGMATHGNEYHDPPLAVESDLTDHTGASNPHGITAEDISALSLDGGTIAGQLRIGGGGPDDNRLTNLGVYAKAFGTDDSNNEPGQIMFDLVRSVYDRDDNPTIAGISQIGYNSNGSGWFANVERYLAGLELYGRNGSTRVPALRTDHQGNVELFGDVDIQGALSTNGEAEFSETVRTNTTGEGLIIGDGSVTNHYISFRNSGYGPKIGFSDNLPSGVGLAFQPEENDTGKGMSFMGGDAAFGHGTPSMYMDGDNYSITIYQGLDVRSYLTFEGDPVATENYVDTEVSNIESGGSGESGNEIVVTDGAELQNAVDNSKVVRIAGDLDMSAQPTVTVPQDCCIYGYGTHRNTDWTSQSDKLLDDKAGPTLHIEGNNVRMFGFGIENVNADGDAIRTDGYSSNLSHLDIFAGRYGIRATSPTPSDIDTARTEPRVNFCRLRSESGLDSGSIGIFVENQHDANLTTNIVCGFDIAIDAATSDAFVFDNHTYAHPATDYNIGVRLAGTRNRVIGNRFEGYTQTAGIQIAEQGYNVITSNLVQAGAGAHGVDFADTAELQLSVVSNNLLLTGSDGEGATGINVAASSVWNFFTESNAVYGFADDGYVTPMEAAGAGNAPSDWMYQTGQIVLNSDDNTMWLCSPDNMLQVGGGSGGSFDHQLTETLVGNGNDIESIASMDVERLYAGAPHGSDGRMIQIASAESTTLYVDTAAGSDSNDGTEASPFATVQHALDQIPAFVGTNYIIEVANGTYDEDLTVGPFTAYPAMGEPVRITGDTTTPSNVVLGSVTIIGVVGVANPTIEGIALSRDATTVTDTGALRIFGSGELKAKDIAFVPEGDDIAVGVMAYAGANADVRGIDITGTVAGFESKRGSNMTVRNVTGSATEYAYTALEGGKLTFFDSDATGGTALRYTVQGGEINSGYEKWTTVYDGHFEAEAINATIETPSFIGQGDGEMRLVAKVASDERGDDIDVDMTITGVTAYNVITEDGTGTRSSSTTSTLPLASGIGGSYSGARLEYTIDSPRDRVYVLGNGVDRRLETTYLVKGATDTSPNPGYDDITLTSSAPVTEANIKVEARRMAAEDM